MITQLFENNLRWVAARNQANPDHLVRSSKAGAPGLLWIGCSDCQMPAHDVLGLPPTQVWVYNNVANLIREDDLSLSSALCVAVDQLKIRHIAVCGHYGCAAMAEAVETRPHDVLAPWFQPVRDLHENHHESLEIIADGDARMNHLAELNTRAQVWALARHPVVRAAWARRKSLALHGWILSARDGLLRDLEASVRSFAQAQRLFSPARQTVALRPEPTR